MSEAAKPSLGYVVCMTMPDGSFVGGALVTDGSGMPVEFRHTEPVLPTRLQRVLYGRVLESYMHNEVVLGALAGALDGKPALTIVADPAYLPGAAGFGPPAVWIAEARNVPSKEPGLRHDLSDAEYILHLGPGNGPVRARMHLVGAASVASLRETTAGLLLGAAGGMEIVEPLRRVEEALRLLWDEQSRPASSIPILSVAAA